jgi:hypothetical protein
MTAFARSLGIDLPVHRGLESRRQLVVTELAGVTADSVVVAFRGDGYDGEIRNNEQQ